MTLPLLPCLVVFLFGFVLSRVVLVAAIVGPAERLGSGRFIAIVLIVVVLILVELVRSSRRRAKKAEGRRPGRRRGL